MGAQPPIMRSHEGGGSDDVLAWEGRFSAGLAVFIRRHLAADPAPRGSQLGQGALPWAEALEEHSAGRLAASGATRLRALP